MKIGFVGMTHLGLISAAAAARKGFDVIGVDDHYDQSWSRPVIASEPGFTPPLVVEGFGILSACDLVFITHDVDNPTDAARVAQLFDLAAGNSTCPIVVMSQVPIGMTRRLAKAHDVETFYQLDTLRMGHAMERALQPEIITIGCAARDVRYPTAYLKYLNTFNCRMNFCLYEEAEIAKSMINVYLAAQVAVTNVGAAVCEQQHVNWSAVIPTLQADVRIGPKAYLKPGNGFDGSHLVRDVLRIQNEVSSDLLASLYRSRLGVI